MRLVRPCFAPRFRPHVQDSETVLLLSDVGETVLRGALYTALSPLLKGELTPLQIADALAPRFRREEVYYALLLLEKGGYLLPKPPTMLCPLASPTLPFVPLEPTSQPVAFSEEGGLRSQTPEAFLARYEAFSDPLTGIIAPLKRLSPPNSAYPVYSAGANRAFSPSENLEAARVNLRALSLGKGFTEAQAQASALGEAFERYSCTYRGDANAVWARFTEMGEEAIDPRSVLLFSEQQYAQRNNTNPLFSPFHFVPEAFDPHERIEWTPAWSLTEQRRKWVPTALCWFGYDFKSGRRFCRADSNGCASGATREEAILQGILELVERDAVSIWWHNRLRRPAIDFAAFGDPALESLQKECATRYGRTVWALDVTSDLGIPAFVCVSGKQHSARPTYLMGFGAHLDAGLALRRAASEMAQILVCASPFLEHWEAQTPLPESASTADRALREWFETATAETQPYLPPDHTMPSRTPTHFACHTLPDLRDNILFCMERLRVAGVEMLAMEATHPALGLPVVRVFAPGLRHFWRRLAPGRLYEVPSAQGWLEHALTEPEMNSTPLFL